MRNCVQALVAGLLGFAVSVSFGASFDCSKSRSKVEVLICSSPALSSLDDALDSSFRVALGSRSQKDKQKLLDEQKKWLTARSRCDIESCLTAEYKLRISVLNELTTIETSQPLLRTDTFARFQAPFGKGYPAVIGQIEGNLVYEHYDDTGNTKNIVELDFTTGQTRILIPSRRDPRLVAYDAKYFVLHEPKHPPSFPIEVIERSTGRVVKQLRLAQPIFNAYVDGQLLVLIQGMSGYGEDAALKLTKLTLPSLKLVEETTLPGVSILSATDGKIVTVRYKKGIRNLQFYDYQFQELGSIALPAPIEKLNLNCDPGNFRQEGNMAVVVANCGEIHVIDLKTFSVERTIPRRANFYSLVLRNGLIYTTTEKKSGIVIFDAKNGQEMARMPIHGVALYAKGDTLLVLGEYSRYEKDQWPLAAYKIDDSSIRNGSWRVRSIRSACSKAHQIQPLSDDIYRDVDQCGASGFDGLIFAGNELPAELTPLALEYASLLSRTLHQYQLGLEVFDKLGKVSTRQASDDRYEAQLKKALFQDGKDMSGDGIEQRGDFSRALARGLGKQPLITFELPSSLIGGDLFFLDDLGVATRWSCYQQDDGVYVHIFDRKSLGDIEGLKVLGCDSEQQDNVSNVAADRSKLYVQTTFRYQDSKRNNYFVYDRKSWKRLVAKPFEIEKDPFPGGSNNDTKRDEDSTIETKSLIVKREYKPPRTQYSFFKRGNAEAAPLPIASFVMSDTSSDMVSVPGTDHVIFIGERDDFGRTSLIDFAPLSGKSKKFAVIPDLGARVADSSGIYVSNGADVLVFDAGTLNLIGVLPRTFRKNWRDREGTIANLYLDQGRLFVRTFGGTTYVFDTNWIPK